MYRQKEGDERASDLLILARQLYLHVGLQSAEEVRVNGIPENTGTAVGCLHLQG